MILKPAAGTATEPHAEQRIARTITAVTGAAALFLLATSIAPILSTAEHLSPVYVIAAPILVFGGFGLLVLVTFLVPLRGIRRAHGVYAVLFLAVCLAWLPSLVSALPVGQNLWVLEIATLGTVPAAIAWPAPLAWAYLIGNSVIVAPIRYLSTGAIDWSSPLQYALLTITLSGIFTALAMAAMRNGKAVDAATTMLRETAARSAAAAARTQEQTRLDALVHDEVMSTLFYASRDDLGLGDSVRSQAAHALAQLERLRTGRDDSDIPVSASTLVTRLRSVVLEASPNIRFEVAGTRTRIVPPDVAEAFAEATSEAARNSLIHAIGANVRTVIVRLGDDAVRVEVRDDGDGFDVREVEPHRLGIQVSIRGRMGTLAGGSAKVESRPAHGTMVTLEWLDE